jgi:hypothetical protein
MAIFPIAAEEGRPLRGGWHGEPLRFGEGPPPPASARHTSQTLRRGLHWTGSVGRCDRPAPSMRHLSHVFRSGVAVSYCGRPVDLEDHPAGAPAAELMDSMLILLVQYLEEIIVEKLEDDVRFPRRVAQLVQGLLGAWRWP